MVSKEGHADSLPGPITIDFLEKGATVNGASYCQLPGSGRVDTAVWMHHLDANKTAEEEARRQLHKNAASNIE